MYLNKPTPSVVRRMTIQYALICTLFCAAVFALVSVQLRASAFKRIDQVLRDELDEFAHIYAKHGMTGLLEEFERETDVTGADELFYRLLSPDGEILFASDLRSWPHIEQELKAIDTPDAHRMVFASIYPNTHPLNARVASAKIGDAGVLQLGMTLRHENRSHQRTRHILFVGSLLMIALSTVSGWLIARKAMSGVRRVTETVTGIRKDSLYRRVPGGEEGYEINELAEAFNQMLQRIEDLVRELKEVSDNVAHDLRSPITRMRGAAETTLTGSQELERYREMGLLVIEESDRLSEIINTMLEITQSESGLLNMDHCQVDIRTLLINAIDLFQAVADEKKIRLLPELPADPMLLSGDKARLQRAVANLMDNAIKYTPEGGTVGLSCQRKEQHLQIKISDSGVGIGPEELPRIFERFYRCEKSRSTSGNGLGLCLAKAIIQAHGGKLSVDSHIGEGTTFTITLRLA